MLSRGNPVRVEEIAAAAGRPNADRAALAESLEAAGIEFDAEDNVVGAGLTLVPTQHRLEVEGRTLYTWCALDTLIFPILLGRPARVESTCTVTGSIVRLYGTPAGVGTLSLLEATVSLIAPAASKQVRRAFCDYVHFFASADDAASWLAEHPDAVVIHAAEAFEVGKVLVSVYLSLRSMVAPAIPRRRSERRRRADPVEVALDTGFFRGLGDLTRLRILDLLLDGERTVSEIVHALDGLQGRISSHLMCLRLCGYVTTRRDGKWVYYAVTDARVREILRLAQSMRRDHAESLAACAVIGARR